MTSAARKVEHEQHDAGTCRPSQGELQSSRDLFSPIERFSTDEGCAGIGKDTRAVWKEKGRSAETNAEGANHREEQCTSWA